MVDVKEGRRDTGRTDVLDHLRMLSRGISRPTQLSTPILGGTLVPVWMRRSMFPTASESDTLEQIVANLSDERIIELRNKFKSHSEMIPHAVTLTPSNPAPLSSEPHAEMYKKLGLDGRHVEFLEADYNPKFLQYFEVGNEKLPMYGSIARMAQESKLVKTLLGLDPPYMLASNMVVYGGALTLLWLNLNGFPDVGSRIRTLSLPGFFNLFQLINYFDIRGVFMSEFMSNYNSRIGGLKEEDLVSNAEMIAQLIDRLGFPVTMYVWDPRQKFLKIEEIANRLTRIPVLREFAQQGTAPLLSPVVGSVDRRTADNPRELLKALRVMGYDTDSEGTLYGINIEQSTAPVHSYNVLRYANYILLKDMAFTGPSDAGKYEIINLPSTPSNPVREYYRTVAYTISGSEVGVTQPNLYI